MSPHSRPKGQRYPLGQAFTQSDLLLGKGTRELVTSFTETTAYQALGVLELWVYSQGELIIYVLQEKEYQESSFSPNFPNLMIIKTIPKVIVRAKIVGSSQALEEFENNLRNNTP